MLTDMRCWLLVVKPQIKQLDSYAICHKAEATAVRKRADIRKLRWRVPTVNWDRHYSLRNNIDKKRNLTG